MNKAHRTEPGIKVLARVWNRLADLKLLALVGALSFSTLLGGAAQAADEAGGDASDKPSFSGNVSWYGAQFHGRKTASGEIFDMKKSTAAHRKLPFFTKVLVENPRSGKSVVVKVNDRGPYAKGRVLDLSRGAAEKLGILLGGVAFVDCTVLGKDAKTSMERLIISEGDQIELLSVEKITLSNAPADLG
jgi:rare lipoprotein A